MSATPIGPSALPRLSHALAQAVLAQHPTLRSSPSQASTSALALDASTTARELGPALSSVNGLEGASRRSEEELRADLEAEEVARDVLVGHYNKAVEELSAMKPAKVPSQPSETRLALLRQEEALLRAELAASREANRPPPIPKTRQPDPTEASLAALARTIVELELAVDRAERALVRNQQLMVRDDVLMADAMALTNALHAQLLLKREQVPPGADQLLARAQARSQRVTAAFGSLMSTLVAFIDDRLASSTFFGENGVMDEDEEHVEEEDESDADEEEIKDRRRRRAATKRKGQKLSLDAATSIQAYFAAPPAEEQEDEPMEDDAQEGPAHLPRTAEEKAMALKALLENLMNTAVSATSGPSSWLAVRAPPASSARTVAQFPPSELVDFLLRAGVVRERAGDPSRVRLVEFGKRVGEEAA